MAQSPFRLWHWIARFGVVAGLAGGACVIGSCSTVVSTATTAWQALLEPVPPGTVGGSVAVLSRAGSADAAIQISGGQPGAMYRWRIRSGSCEVAGDIIGGVAVYPVLSPGGSEEAEASTVLSRGLDPDTDYAALVFRVVEEGERLEACGELVLLTA